MAASNKPKRFFIVNPAGAVHEVSEAHARWRLQSAGWRMASEAEVSKYLAAKVQRFDRPIAEPWNPNPAAESATQE